MLGARDRKRSTSNTAGILASSDVDKPLGRIFGGGTIHYVTSDRFQLHEIIAEVSSYEGGKGTWQISLAPQEGLTRDYRGISNWTVRSP